jgi:glucosamine--fructose-6-phosphate aminotransferase (isomerizing)
MDDMRATLGAFDADAPLPAAPDPWDYLPMPARRDGPPWATAEAIAAEPALVARIGRRLLADGSAAALAAMLRETAALGEPVIVTGCGTSEHAAMGVAAILREGWRTAGLPGAGPVSEQALELALDPPHGGLVIGVSHEGGTGATIAALDAARANGARIWAITASAAAPVTHHTDGVLATLELDLSWCHTVGYVSPLAAATLTTGFLAGHTPDPDRLTARLLAGIDAAFGPHAAFGAALAVSTRLLVIASGVDRVTAKELALKIEEAAWIPTTARDLETFLHGHLPATGSTTGLILVLLERGSLDRRAERARQALAAAAEVGVRCGAILGADAAALVPARLTPAGRIVVPEAPRMPGAPAALLGAAGPLQLLTLGITDAVGNNPDPIRRDDPRYLRAADVADAPQPVDG